MSEQTNNLLHLFSKILSNPRFMTAIRRNGMAQRLQRGAARSGARGLLFKLWEKDGLTNAELAELLDIRPSSVTAQVKQLEEGELIERRPDENDGRVSRVFLTEKGKDAKKIRYDRHDNESESLFGDLSDEEQENLKEILTHLDEIWAEKTEDTSDLGYSWPNISHRDWKALSSDERRALKREFADNMRQMKQNLRASHKDWKRDLDPYRTAGMGRPNGDFMDWVTGPSSADDIAGWQERHFGQGSRPGFDGHGADDGHGRADKKDDNEDWTDF